VEDDLDCTRCFRALNSALFHILIVAGGRYTYRNFHGDIWGSFRVQISVPVAFFLFNYFFFSIPRCGYVQDSEGYGSSPKVLRWLTTSVGVQVFFTLFYFYMWWN
jgi:hypothetical protein